MLVPTNLVMIVAKANEVIRYHQKSCSLSPINGNGRGEMATVVVGPISDEMNK
jgi:hypothetical protein